MGRDRHGHHYHPGLHGHRQVHRSLGKEELWSVCKARGDVFMSAVAAKPTAGGAMDVTATIIGIIILLIVIALTYYLVGPGLAFMALIGIIVGGILVAFGVHFVPVGGAPAAMGQAP